MELQPFFYLKLRRVQQSNHQLAEKTDGQELKLIIPRELSFDAHVVPVVSKVIRLLVRKHPRNEQRASRTSKTNVNNLK